MIEIIRAIVLVFLFGCVTAFGVAGPVRRAPDLARDQSQTMEARRRLLAEPELAAFNIGVTVRDRVAILWGPVPSAEVAFRAELCVRTMTELAEVRNELIVNELAEPMRRPLKIIEPPAPRLPELLPPVLPKDARSRSPSPGVLTGKDGNATKLPRAQTAPRKATTKSEDKPPDSNAKPRPVGTESELTTAIRALLQRTPAYAAVQFSVVGGGVVLRSREFNQSDVLQEAARAIARLPGVESVIVLDQTDRKTRD